MMYVFIFDNRIQKRIISNDGVNNRKNVKKTFEYDSKMTCRNKVKRSACAAQTDM